MRTGTPGHLKSFDQVGFHRYFLTFCTNKRERLFMTHDVVDLVRTQILRAAADEKFAILVDCFMPDHLHVLSEAESESAAARSFVKRAKQLSGFYYSRTYGRQRWQRYGYERVLRAGDDTLGVAKYILENPVRGGLVKSSQDYPFSGSARYSVQESLEAVSWKGPRSA
jgi:REP-associated tyrosine transposase